MTNPQELQHQNKEYEAVKKLEEIKKRVTMIEEWNKVCENDINAGFQWDQASDYMGVKKHEEYVRVEEEYCYQD